MEYQHELIETNGSDYYIAAYPTFSSYFRKHNSQLINILRENFYEAIKSKLQQYYDEKTAIDFSGFYLKFI